MKQCLLLACGLFFALYVQAQCVFPEGREVPDLACDAGDPLSDGANIGTGVTRHFNGTGGVFSNISLSGGTLVLCGTATLNNVSHNGGVILIKPGADITFTGSYNIGGTPHLFYNLGSVTFPSNVQLQGSDQFVYNGPGATLEVEGEITFLNNGKLFNYGTTIAHRIVINGSNVELCFGPGAVNITESIVSDGTGNTITVPSGEACVSYSDQLTGNSPLTATANLRVCQAPGASNPAPNTLGGATLVPDCSSCSVALPVILSAFNVQENNGQVHLTWKTDMEFNVNGFVIEKSTDGVHFTGIVRIPARNTASDYQHTIPGSGRSYFRLKMVDNDGSVTYSRVIAIQVSAQAQWRLLANPVQTAHLELYIQASATQNGLLSVFNGSGQLIGKKPVRVLKGDNILTYPLGNLPAGSYYVQYHGHGMESYKTLRFLKN